MSRNAAAQEAQDETRGHGDRPWVYFMIDCFLLMTNFFIITFQFKVQEPILPQRMPPGTTRPGPPCIYDPPPRLLINCQRNGDQVVYEFLSRRVNLAEVSATLATLSQSGNPFGVKVSYSDTAQWQDVMDVFNECEKYKIHDCGLVATHD